MLNAKIPNATRKDIYRRDGFMCALCGSTKGLQIHHYLKRSLGGSDRPMNLIALCWKCHATAHGTILPEYQEANVSPDDIEQHIVEYLSDYYAERGKVWWPKEG